MSREAQEKFWGCPELIEMVLPFLDSYSTLQLAQVHRQGTCLREALSWRLHGLLRVETGLKSFMASAEREDLKAFPSLGGFPGFVVWSF